ncbi:plasmid mobilization protein [Robinsoniella peoriensis]
MKEDQNRDKRLNVRLRETEYQAFLERCEEYGEQSYSDYIRRCIFSDELAKSQALLKELHQTNYQIRKIGVLVNQIAHKVNGGYAFTRGNEQSILKKMDEIENMFRIVQEQILGGGGNHSTD